MNLKSYITKITFAAIATMLSGLAAQATPITVPNASFETPTSPSETASWMRRGRGGELPARPVGSPTKLDGDVIAGVVSRHYDE